MAVEGEKNGATQKTFKDSHPADLWDKSQGFRYGKNGVVLVSAVCLVTTSPFTFCDCFNESSTPRPCPNSLIPFSVSHVLQATSSCCHPCVPCLGVREGRTSSAGPSRRKPRLSHFWGCFFRFSVVFDAVLLS